MRRVIFLRGAYRARDFVRKARGRAKIKKARGRVGACFYPVGAQWARGREGA